MREKLSILIMARHTLSILGVILQKNLLTRNALLEQPVLLVWQTPTSFRSAFQHPLDVHNEPDLTYVLESTRAVAKILRKGQLVVLESTTYPGTTRDEMLPILEESGLKHGEDFFLAYSPEREDPGRKSETTQSIPKLVGGIDEIQRLACTCFLFHGC